MLPLRGALGKKIGDQNLGGLRAFCLLYCLAAVLLL